jgi:hypothetical protein
MTHVHYTYEHPQARRYTFTSIGRRRIEKVVDFVPFRGKNVMNFGFGDLLPDGSIDVKANSNNGDLLKVMATVVDILKHFTAKYPNTVVYFIGSTDERTRLYGRILRTYYQSFSIEFALYGIIGEEGAYEAVPFDPMASREYLAFLIKRNI